MTFSTLSLRPLFPLALLAFLCAQLAACSTSASPSDGKNSVSIIRHIQPYRIDVRQGNDTTQDMVNRLRPGLSMDQVRFVLGTPLLSDIFHADRWDYVYRLETGLGQITQKRLTVFFDPEGRLARVEGDYQWPPLQSERAEGAPDRALAPEAPVNRVITINRPDGK
jgi:outer membrane protein assembly factor BamE (lipoprotein component of BamABCDE complex)